MPLQGLGGRNKQAFSCTLQGFGNGGCFRKVWEIEFPYALTPYYAFVDGGKCYNQDAEQVQVHDVDATHLYDIETALYITPFDPYHIGGNGISVYIFGVTISGADVILAEANYSDGTITNHNILGSFEAPYTASPIRHNDGVIYALGTSPTAILKYNTSTLEMIYPSVTLDSSVNNVSGFDIYNQQFYCINSAKEVVVFDLDGTEISSFPTGISGTIVNICVNASKIIVSASNGIAYKFDHDGDLICQQYRAAGYWTGLYDGVFYSKSDLSTPIFARYSI